MTMGLEDDGVSTTGNIGAVTDAAVVGMDIEERTEAVVAQSDGIPKRSSLQTEVVKSVGKKSIGMQKIDEEEEEDDDDILGIKTRNWKQINLSFTVDLIGQEGEDIRRTDYFQCTGPKEGNNMPMKHHPIMSKIANFLASVEKKCPTVKVMSSKKKMVLDVKACTDSWSINAFKTSFAYSVSKTRQRNVQVTLYIDYGMTHSLWKLKNRVMDSLRKEGLWIVSHNGPIEVVETTQIGFFAGLHPELYRRGYQDNINRRIAVHFNTNKATLIMRAHEIPELKDFLGPMPQAQVIPITIPGMSTDGGKSQKVLSMGVSVPSKFRALFKYILYSISNDMGIEYVDFSMKYDKQRKVLYNKLVRSHQEFMHHHKTINIHCMERDEMHTCMNELMAINSVIAIDETVITERNGTWVLVLQYNDQTGFEQTDLDTIDRIIATNPPMIDRKLHHQPFRKRDPIERLDLEALSLQEKKYKNFTATPFNTTNSWSSKLFPPKNIITQRGDGRSNKTAVSITDDDTVATLTDTVNNLQQSIERLATELRQTNRTMTTIDSRLITEETRGQQQSTAIGYLEQSQLLTTETMSRQMEQARAEARDSRDEARAEALVTMDKLDRSMEQAREEAKKDRELAKKDSEAAAEKAAASAHAMELMISQLLKHNNTPSTPPISRQTNITNNNTAQAVTNNGDIVLHPDQSHEKRKQVDKTPSVTPDEQEITSPTRRKQRSERSIPAVINFDNYTEETSNQFTNGHMQATADTEMTNHDEESSSSSVLSGALPSLVVDVKPILFSVLKSRRILHTKFSTLPNNLTLTTFIPMTVTLYTD